MIYPVVLAFALLRGAWYWRRRPITTGRGRVLAWAYGDGKHDDAPHVQRALNHGGVVKLPPACLRIGRTLNVSISGIHIQGAPTAFRWKP